MYRIFSFLFEIGLENALGNFCVFIMKFRIYSLVSSLVGGSLNSVRLNRSDLAHATFSIPCISGQLQ